ncbi:MAG: hypothetical protein FD123_814 [Bacteroidetes bacterium]|nr:MAG: hypothetical protein FD123_814 [Bacteroidota bacterium]
MQCIALAFCPGDPLGRNTLRVLFIFYDLFILVDEFVTF